MANKTTKTDAEVAAKMQNPEAMPEFANFQEEQLGFPPYWEAEVGKWFFGMIIALDDRDPEFMRYVVQNSSDIPLDCAVGPTDEQERVMVGKDEMFTLSVYGGLPLEQFIGMKCLIKCVSTRDTGKPNPMFVFKLFVSPEDKKILLQDRKERAAKAMQAYREAKAAKALKEAAAAE